MIRLQDLVRSTELFDLASQLSHPLALIRGQPWALTGGCVRRRSLELAGSSKFYGPCRAFLLGDSDHDPARHVNIPTAVLGGDG